MVINWLWHLKEKDNKEDTNEHGKNWRMTQTFTFSSKLREMKKMKKCIDNLFRSLVCMKLSTKNIADENDEDGS